jgi:hypothetical protein
MYKSGGALGVQMLNSTTTLIQRDNQGGSPMQTMYYIGLDVHKKKISYCVKDGSGHIHAEGAIPAARSDLDRWMKTLPAPFDSAPLALSPLHVACSRQRLDRSFGASE